MALAFMQMHHDIVRRDGPWSWSAQRNAEQRVMMRWTLMWAATVAPSLAAQGVPDSLTSRTRLFPFPFAFYQPETKVGGGVGLLVTSRLAPDARPSTSSILLVITQRKQYSVLVSGEWYTRGNRYRLTPELVWSKFPDFFYGIGNETRQADEESWTLEQRRLVLDVRRAVRRSLYVGGALFLQNTGVADIEPGGLLAAGVIGDAGGTLVGPGVVAVLDTREHPVWPRGGGQVTLSFRGFHRDAGSDYGFARVEVDARGYWSLADGHVIAAQLVATGISGTAPFYELSPLGGSSLSRGYYEGRYRNRHRMVGQVEYRFPLFWRFSGVAFGSVGQVMANWSDLRPGDFHPAGGVGGRLLFSRSERVNLRVDVAWGRGDSGLYFGLSEAF